MLLISNCETGTIFYFSRAFRNFTKIISRHGSVFDHFFLSLNDVKLNTEDLVVCIFKVSAWGYILLPSILSLDSSCKKSRFPGTILIPLFFHIFLTFEIFLYFQKSVISWFSNFFIWLFTMSSHLKPFFSPQKSFCFQVSPTSWHTGLI